MSHFGNVSSFAILVAFFLCILDSFSITSPLNSSPMPCNSPSSINYDSFGNFIFDWGGGSRFDYLASDSFGFSPGYHSIGWRNIVPRSFEIFILLLMILDAAFPLGDCSRSSGTFDWFFWSLLRLLVSCMTWWTSHTSCSSSSLISCSSLILWHHSRLLGILSKQF